MEAPPRLELVKAGHGKHARAGAKGVPFAERARVDCSATTSAHEPHARTTLDQAKSHPPVMPEPHMTKPEAEPHPPVMASEQQADTHSATHLASMNPRCLWCASFILPQSPTFAIAFASTALNSFIVDFLFWCSGSAIAG